MKENDQRRPFIDFGLQRGFRIDLINSCEDKIWKQALCETQTALV